MAKVIKVSELGELTRKNAVFAILDVRDNVKKAKPKNSTNYLDILVLIDTVQLIRYLWIQ